MRKNKLIIFSGVLIFCLLAVVLFMGGGTSNYAGGELALDPSPTEQPVESEALMSDAVNPEEAPEINDNFKGQTAENPEEKRTEVAGEPEVADQPAEPEESKPDPFTCTLSVSCESILNHYEMLKESKRGIIPNNGVIYQKRTVEFFANESVFDVLLREMKESKIPFEFVETPMYNSVYIEGIGNIYEFDCGAHSGWMYKVNGIKPTYSCSQYQLNNGDNIEFFYSCNFLEENE